MKRLTKEEIDLLKAQHGDVFEVTCEDKVCYLKKPDRSTLSYATTVGQSDPMKYNEVVLENCWITGDPEFKTNDEYFLAAIGVMEALVEYKTAEIKKL
jgi:hypothetical protein